ncbi:hypothetical protein ACFSTJ_14290 [Ottowia pentelensis]|uniref:hypothetical protein n=1 Tax=Ottowia pentelensis TaxID=511108 RepID=UPI00362B3662
MTHGQVTGIVGDQQRQRRAREVYTGGRAIENLGTHGARHGRIGGDGAGMASPSPSAARSSI